MIAAMLARVVVVCSGMTLASTSAAQVPITDRDYAIDYYEGIAIGDTRQVGMGGAGAALLVGTAGTLLNASAPAIRPTTDNDPWSWDWHFDYVTSTYSTDYDNNGIRGEAGSLITVGLGARVGDWGAALTLNSDSRPITADDWSASALHARFALAKWFPRRDLSVGAGLHGVVFQVFDDREDLLFAIRGTGVMWGATWVPSGRDFRLAASVESQILGGDTDAKCDPNDCQGYILPNEVVSGARVVAGVSYRFGPTPWNEQVKLTFRDERALTIAADVHLTAPTEDAYGIEAFGRKELQRSGASFELGVRAGAEYEWLPGRLRLRAGSYYEPARFSGERGRIHGTFGIELRFLEFHLFGRRRMRVSFTGDRARQFQNFSFGVGFWH